MKIRMNLSIDSDVAAYLRHIGERERKRLMKKKKYCWPLGSVVAEAVRKTEGFKEWRQHNDGV